MEEFHSDRMKVIQLDVCSDEQVDRAVEFIKDNLADSGRGKQPCACIHEQKFKEVCVRVSRTCICFPL